MIQPYVGKSVKIHFFIFIFFVLTLLLIACSNQQNVKPKTSSKNEKQKEHLTALGESWKLPISIPEGEFYKLGGWISDNQVLYITNHEQTSSVYRYHLLTGKSELLYKSDSPIVTVQISPSKKYILIQSSPSSYEGLITIIDTMGSEKLKQPIASYELAFEWNPYKESQILVSKFNEDWTFKTFLLDMNISKMTELSLPQPFIKWVDEQKIAFLNWDENNPSLFAPLIEKNLGNATGDTIFPGVLQFSSFPNVLMTVTVNEQDQSSSTYSFYGQKKKKIFSFSIPHLTRFTDWLVPFFDYNQKKEQFITFKPLKNAEADSYTEGFELVSYDIKKGKSNLIMAGLENEPLNFSPSGEAILVGNRFEKIIDIKAKKIYELIKE